MLWHPNPLRRPPFTQRRRPDFNPAYHGIQGRPLFPGALNPQRSTPICLKKWFCYGIRNFLLEILISPRAFANPGSKTSLVLKAFVRSCLKAIDFIKGARTFWSETFDFPEGVCTFLFESMPMRPMWSRAVPFNPQRLYSGEPELHKAFPLPDLQNSAFA